MGAGASIAALPAFLGLTRARPMPSGQTASLRAVPPGLDWLFRGVAGHGLTGGYHVASISHVDRGAVTLELAHTDGSAAHVQVFRRSPLSRGLATTSLLDLRLMNGADGGEVSTHEGLGVAVLTLAAHLRRVETLALGGHVGSLDRDRRASVRALCTHEQRVALHGGFEDGLRQPERA